MNNSQVNNLWEKNKTAKSLKEVKKFYILEKNSELLTL